MKKTALVVFSLIAVAALWALRPRPAATERPSPSEADETSQTFASNTPASTPTSTSGPRRVSQAVSSGEESSSPSSANETAQAVGKAAIALPARSQDQDGQPGEFARRYGTGVSWSSESGTFELLKLRAVRKGEDSGDLSPLLFEKNGRLFFESADPAVAQARLDGRSWPVVARTSNGMIGFLSGTLLVMVKDRNAVESVASAHGLSVKTYDEDLRLAYLAVEAPGSVLEALQALKNDPSVETVQPEVVQSFKRY